MTGAFNTKINQIQQVPPKGLIRNRIVTPPDLIKIQKPLATREPFNASDKPSLQKRMTIIGIA